MKSEQSFEYKIQHLLENHGFLVINCARSKPFDLVAIKNQIAVPLELKGKNTLYNEKQKLYQKGLASRTRTNFLVIKQGKKRGYIEVNDFCARGNDTLFWQRIKQEIINALRGTKKIENLQDT
jgi:Holliday junction resolvase